MRTAVRPGVERQPTRSTSGKSREPAHLPLHRRLLFPTYPHDKPLPILVPGDGPDIAQLNERLYHLIALVLRAYVLTWLPRITRDRSLLPHIHQTIILPILLPIIAHIHDQRESLVPFLLYDIPSILTLHVRTYWSSVHSLSIHPAPLDEAYHARLPLLAVEKAFAPGAPEPGRNSIPEGQYVLSGLWLTALSEAICKLSLPPDEYGVVVERVMIREIIGRTVLGGVGRRLSEDWFWWGLLLKFVPAKSPRAKEEESSSAQFVLSLVTKVCTGLVALWAFGTWAMATLSAAPTAYDGATEAWMALLREGLGVDGRHGCGRRRWASRLVWGMIEMAVYLLSPFTDRLLPHLVQTSILQPKTALRLVDMLEKILFPLDGFPVPTPPDLTPAEADALRRELEERLSSVIPKTARQIFVPSHRDLRHLLNPLSDPGCNAHLVGMLYMSTVGALIPDLVVGQDSDVSPSVAGTDRR